MKIALGTAAIGRPQYINIRESISNEPFDMERFIQSGKQIISDAYSSGVRHFDTAPGYGIAEQILLEWIEENEPKDITVSTKWGYTYVANFDPKAQVHEIKEHSVSKLEEQWQQSQKFLPYLNIYQIHSATLDSGVLENVDVLERLAQLKEEHFIEIGFSTSGANQNDIIKKASEVEINGEVLFDSVQVTYNVFDQSLLEIESSLKNKNVIIKEALANGRVFPNVNYLHYERHYSLIEKLAKKYDVGVDAVALRFCLDTLNPFMVLSGVTEMAHLKSNLQANTFKLSEDEIDQIKNLSVQPQSYWSERKNLIWN